MSASERSGDMAKEGATLQTASIQRRDIVRRGEIEVRVLDAAAAQKKAETIIKSLNGYTESSRLDNSPGTTPSVSLTARVPVANFDRLTSDISGLGTVIVTSSSAEDVTLQLVDMEARLRTLLAQEDAYRAILQKASKIADVVAVQEKLTEIRQVIESLDAQRKAVADMASYSTLAISLTQRVDVTTAPKDPDWARGSWAAATAGLGSFFRGLAQVAIWLFVWSPVWLGAALVIRFLVLRARKKKVVVVSPPSA
jgi:hypothetical protein